MGVLEDRLIQAAGGGEDEGYAFPPLAYDERTVPAEERDWVYDFGENAVPQSKGFVTDFVYYTRGYETPTLSCIWSALFLLSTVIKRQAWMKWHPRSLYPNLYMMVIGPAGRVKKTTAVVELGMPILEGFRQYIRDANVYHMKDVQIVKDKSTPEAMLDAMLPENRPGSDYWLVDAEGKNLTDSSGKAIVYKKTSETSIIISELSTFLTKRSYGEGTLQLLIDLYDCRDTWEWRTMGKGVKKLRQTYTCFIAGTTVEGMRNSIPDAAMGDGFMSRTIPVYVPYTKRQYPIPHRAKGSPSMEEMCKRLAWVAEHGLGEYQLSRAAQAEYEKWYKHHHKTMDESPGLSGALSRMSTNVLKVALLMRIGRYEEVGTEVQIEDFMDAVRLMDVTYSSLPFLLSQLDADVVMSESGRLYDYVKRRGKVVRKYALSSMRMRGEILTAVVDELCGRGVMCVMHNGKKYMQAGGRTDEEYVYVEDEDDRKREDRGPGAASRGSYTGHVWVDANGCADAGSEPHGFTEMDEPARGRVPPADRGRPTKRAGKRTKINLETGTVDNGPSGRYPTTEYRKNSRDNRVHAESSEVVPLPKEEDEEDLDWENAGA